MTTTKFSPSVSFNSLACQNFGIDVAKIIELFGCGNTTTWNAPV